MSAPNSEDNDRFEVGGEILFNESLHKQQEDDSKTNETESTITEKIEDIRVRIGTLLKTDTVSLLLGAGASVACGGQLIGKIPILLEEFLLEKGVNGENGKNVESWLVIFYLAIRHIGGDEICPDTSEKIIARQKGLKGLSDISDEKERAGKEQEIQLKVNFERVLALLHRWRSALPKKGGRLRIDCINEAPALDAKAEDLDKAIQHATCALARACDLPVSGKENALTIHKTLIRKLLTRPLNLKRVNIFTLNYDTLIEQAADAEGVVLLDGFVGTQRSVFRPECYEQDLYFPAETTEGRVHRFDRVLHLYKLHGSITWKQTETTLDNPYGIEAVSFDTFNQDKQSQPLLIYPTPAKYGETLGLPYSELFRRFANAIVRDQSTLFAIGYGFGDEHVNAIIRQALSVPSFTLVIVDPAPMSDFVEKLREQRDRRIWIAEGHTLGTIRGFVENLLPDLRDEEIRKQVLATYRALSK